MFLLVGALVESISDSLRTQATFLLFSLVTNVIIMQLWFLAHLVMSLCNHALSIMWCCHQCHCHHWHHLCTSLPVTALIIETSYLSNICIYTPSMCT